MIVEFEEVDSTQDIAHEMAEKGAEAGTVVVAQAQRVGRGREGRAWVSGPGEGVGCSIVERPATGAGVGLLALRVALGLAESLDRYADERIMVKWPNDLLVGGQKLGGILVDTRWSGSRLGWAVVGVGVNVVTPSVNGAVGLRAGTKREEVLTSVIGAVRRAAEATADVLSPAELGRLSVRDALAGKRIVLPGRGVVRGIDPSGALVVDGVAHRSGTVQLENGS